MRWGYVSADNARAWYGVVIEDGRLDSIQTQHLRAERLARNTEGDRHFDYGPERTAFESIWTAARYAKLTTHLSTVAPVWRHFLKIKIFDAIKWWTVADAGDTWPELIDEIFGDLLKR